MARKRLGRRQTRSGPRFAALLMNGAMAAGALGLLVQLSVKDVSKVAGAGRQSTPGDGSRAIVHALPAPGISDATLRTSALQSPQTDARGSAAYARSEFTPGDNPPMPAGVGILLAAPRSIARDDAAFAAILKNDGAVANAGRYALARFAVESGGILYEDFALWSRIRAGGSARGVDWADLVAFLKRRQQWPDQPTLLAAAEYAMPIDLPAGQVLDFFGAREPESSRGARRLGEALIATGRQEEGEDRLVKTWRRQTLDVAEEKAFLAAHATLLEPHHPERLEMLMLRRRASAAGRLAQRVNQDWRALTTAVSALFRSGRGVDGLIAKVPDALQNRPSLAFARMVWRQKKRRDSEAEAVLRERQNTEDLGNPDVWAAARRRHTRQAFEQARFRDAYDIAAAHGLESGTDFAELEWFAGWLALRHLDNADAAALHFQKLYRGVGSPISRGRAAYWTGRALAAQDDSFGADAWYALATNYPNTFYGQQAAIELGAALMFKDSTPDETADADVAAVAESVSPVLTQIATSLYRGGRRREAGAFLDARADQEARPEGAVGVALGHGDLKSAIRIASSAHADGYAVWSALYPQPAAPRFTGRRSEAAFLLGIARQESRFQARATSSAGATGLMQMTHGTAKGTARNTGLIYDRAQLDSDPSYNLMLADAHVEELVAKYDGSYLLVAAAYNAGPGAVARWIDAHGDPRSVDVDVIDWIESIPYSETRNYVQRVLEATVVYRALLGAEPHRIAGLPVATIAGSRMTNN